MSRKNGSVNSVDKKLEAVSSTMTADKDPLKPWIQEDQL